MIDSGLWAAEIRRGFAFSRIRSEPSDYFASGRPECADLDVATSQAYFRVVGYIFDSAKDAINQAKHGVFLALAEVLFAGRHVSVIDDRFDYGESRAVAFGFIRERLFVCVYTVRGQARRIISLRKANQREVKLYAKGLE